jgi:hypothetical protein
VTRYADPHDVVRLGPTRLARFLTRYSHGQWREPKAAALLQVARQSLSLWDGDGMDFAALAADIALEADEPVGHVSVNTRAALDRPDPIRHALTYSSITAWPSVSVPNRPVPTIDSSLVMTSIVTDRLCGSIPMTTRIGAFLRLSSEREP